MFNKFDLKFYKGGVSETWDHTADLKEAHKRMPKVQQFQRLLKFLTDGKHPDSPEFKPRALYELCKFWPLIRVFEDNEVSLEKTRAEAVTLLMNLKGQLEAEGYYLPDRVFELTEINREPEQKTLFEDTGLSFLSDYKREQ